LLSFAFIYPPSVDPTTPPLALARIEGTADYYFGGDWDFAFFDENQKFARYAMELVFHGLLVGGSLMPLMFLYMMNLEYSWRRHQRGSSTAPKTSWGR